MGQRRPRRQSRPTAAAVRRGRVGRIGGGRNRVGGGRPIPDPRWRRQPPLDPRWGRAPPLDPIELGDGAAAGSAGGVTSGDGGKWRWQIHASRPPPAIEPVAAPPSAIEPTAAPVCRRRVPRSSAGAAVAPVPSRAIDWSEKVREKEREREKGE